MKKPQNKLQRALRRNFQKNDTKKTGVHVPVAQSAGVGAEVGDSEGVGPVGRYRNATFYEGGSFRERRKPYVGADGKFLPYKLTPELIKRFAASIRATGGPISFHMQALGLGRTSFYEWRKRAEAEPDSIYGELFREIDKAQGERLKVLYTKAEDARPHEILFRTYPDLFPSEAARLQLSGPDGEGLFPSGAQFNVVLELHQPPLGIVDPDADKAFRITKPEGGADLWTGPSEFNGEEPPP